MTAKARAGASESVTDLLFYLNPADLVGRCVRKRKGVPYTARGQRCVNIWSDPADLKDLTVGEVEHTISASANYLWYRRDAFKPILAS